MRHVYPIVLILPTVLGPQHASAIYKEHCAREFQTVYGNQAHGASIPRRMTDQRVAGPSQIAYFLFNCITRQTA
jgi:hypothetical protein